MRKISKFYLDKATYRAEDGFGNSIFLEIDYWNGRFSLSRQNEELEDFARKLLKKKHRVNFAHKMVK